MQFTNVIKSEPRDPHAALRAKLKLGMAKPVAAATDKYSRLVAKVARGGELTEREIADLAELADVLGVDPIQTFINDVEILQRHDTLANGLVGSEERKAALSAEYEGCGAKIDQCREALNAAQTRERMIHSEVASIASHEAALKKLEAENPRIFATPSV